MTIFEGVYQVGGADVLYIRNLLPLYTTAKSNSVRLLVNALEIYDYLLWHGAHVTIPTPLAIV